MYILVRINRNKDSPKLMMLTDMYFKFKKAILSKNNFIWFDTI